MNRPFLIVLVACLLLSLTTEFYYSISIIVTGFVFIRLIQKFGGGIVLLESMAFFTCLIYLLMPIVGYTVYDSSNRLASLWVKYMPVSESQYFGFVLPAVIAFVIGLLSIVYLRPLEDVKTLSNRIVDIKNTLATKMAVTHWLLFIGIASYVMRDFLPDSLVYVGSLGYLFLFSGILYVYFNPAIKFKAGYFVALGAFIMLDALRSGMFTILFYMGITLTSILFIERRIPFIYKIVAIVFVTFVTVTLQSTKLEFRAALKKDRYQGSNFETFRELYTENAMNFSKAFSATSFFPVYSRLNQGYYTALVIRRIPQYQPFDDGRSLVTTIAASFVPRVFWPDKPESGGKYNMYHFAGIRLKGWSSNIGPVGEAYGNFGKYGGILYMFFFGLFLGFVYSRIFILAKKIPLLILWIPMLFYEVVFCMENDTLQALNSIIKAGFFLFILYKLFPTIFKSTNTNFTRIDENSHNLGYNRPGWSIPK